MSYETAPSTVLLASCCAICGRALRDAVSVEAGIGPDCREKYGYGEAQGSADWLKAVDSLGAASGMFGSEGPLTPGWGVDAQKACNVLVHRAACADRSARGPFVVAIGLLGYTRLAKALAKGAGEVVEVTQAMTAEGARLVVKTPFSEAFVAALKAARIGARWDRTIDTGAKKPGAWTVPVDAAAKTGLFRVLKATFAGATLVSAKGLSQIPQA